jgi:hypothetical protein
VVGVGQPDRGRVVGGRDHLDVQRALGGAARQVLEGDVAVVLGRADHACGEVVGAQEVQEVRPRELLLAREHALGDRHPVAGGEPPDQRRRRGALQVHVELGLRDHAILPAITGR